MSFPFYKQFDEKDCGPSCLRMIAKFYGRTFSAEYLNQKAGITTSGVSLSGIGEAAEEIGIKTAVVSVPWQVVTEDVTLPCIVFWRQRHFVVVYKITREYVYVADPAFGKIKYKKKDFLEGWLYNKSGADQTEGMVMLLEPVADFFSSSDEGKTRKKGLGFLIPYILPHKKIVFQLVLALLLVTIFQLCFPFLTQSIVDVGVINQDLNFVYLLIIAQLTLVFSQTAVQSVRDWLLLYITLKINLNLISDFLIKLMRLPLSYYETKNVGDIMQRIVDNDRVQNFLSVTSLSLIFSFMTFLVFSFILIYYQALIFLVFICGSILYFFWSIFFLKKRAEIDYRRFDQASSNQSSIFQLINGMSEIRINGSERKRRWEWETIQVKLFKIYSKSLVVSQIQNTGGVFINEVKNVFITLISASLVIKGELTLGMMLAIQYIVGQLNVPVLNFVAFTQSTQDASLSIKRLEEVYALDNEEQENMKTSVKCDDIIIDDLTFTYPDSPMCVLKNIKTTIPKGKVTAIVGESGSGKTTLLKLLLGFYKIKSGQISIDKLPLDKISPKVWRKLCGVVMQDGFIFTGSIKDNIGESGPADIPVDNRLLEATRIANLQLLVEELPNGYETVVGRGGMNLSGGEKQRILIARSVYKDPDYLFFDEATSALDAKNEKVIMNNLFNFFQGKTVIIIAHRLSTVKNADNIIVLNSGEIIETGTHDELVNKKGKYYELIKNQLELGQ